MIGSNVLLPLQIALKLHLISPQDTLGVHLDVPVETHLNYHYSTITMMISIVNGCIFFQTLMMNGNGEWTFVKQH